MEIRNVVNEVKNEYPKMEQVSKNKLSNSIPRKWLKVGLSSIGIAMIMKNNIFALNAIDVENSMINAASAGAFPAPVPIPIRICYAACPIVQIVSAVTFIMTGLSILITNNKAKKQSELKKVKKWVKILFIISLIAFILSIIIRFIIHTRYHYYYY